MAITRRNLLHTFLGLGGAVVGGGASGLGWLEAEAAAAGALLPLTPVCDDGDADPTDSVVEGPFYVPNTPRRKVLREAGTPGRPLVIQGRVLTPDCRPLAGAVLDFWSCDGEGVYDRGFKLRGHQLTDASGAFRVETVKPAGYTDGGIRRTPHIHVRAQARGTRLLTTQLFFPGEPGNARDLYCRDSLLMRLTQSGGTLVGRFDFVLG